MLLLHGLVKVHPITRSSQVPVACLVAVMHEERPLSESEMDIYTCCTAGDKMGLIAEERHQEFYVSQQYWIPVIEMVCKHHSAKDCLVLNFAHHRLYSVSSCSRFLPQASIACLNSCSMEILFLSGSNQNFNLKSSVRL
jgi:hypothetical protein